jgi:hypothetical protein
VHLMIPAERAICPEFCWHLHIMYPQYLVKKYQYYLPRFVYKIVGGPTKPVFFYPGLFCNCPGFPVQGLITWY